MKQISISSSCVIMHVTHEVTNASFMSPRFRSPCLRSWSVAAHGSRPRWARWSPRSRASWRPRRRSATTPWRARATRTWGSVWRGLSLDTGTWSSYSRLWQGGKQTRGFSFQFHIHDWGCSNIWPDWVSQTWIGNFLPTQSFYRLDLEIILQFINYLEDLCFFFPIFQRNITILFFEFSLIGFYCDRMRICSFPSLLKTISNKSPISTITWSTVLGV